MTHDTPEIESETSSIDHDGSKARNGWDHSSRPSVAIVEAIAEATGTDPEALPSLHRSVDADALDTLLTRGRQRGANVHVSFAYDGALVSVESDGDLSIRTEETTNDPAPTDPETSADLKAMLEVLLRAAYRNGVSVTGGYGVQNGPAVPDWDIHVSEVDKPKGGDR